MKKLFVLASLLSVAPAVYSAASESAVPIDAKAAFDRLRSLVGTWEARPETARIRVTYELIGGGSALVERATAENMPPMETVYHLDGSRLMLTHYCMLGNQPRMQARTFNQATGELKFEFLDVTNLAGPGAAHMHNVTFRFVDADHLASQWQLFENGRLESTESFQLTRVR